MVELGGVFQLCDSAGGRCLGVIEEGEEGQVVLSLDDGTISTYSVSTNTHCAANSTTVLSSRYTMCTVFSHGDSAARSDSPVQQLY